MFYKALKRNDRSRAGSPDGEEPRQPISAQQEAVPARAAAPAPKRILYRLKFEATLFLLLVATFAAVQYQDLIVTKQLNFGPKNQEAYLVYFYDDAGNGGTSTIQSNPSEPLRWSCELGSGFEFPFCGYGLLFDKAGVGQGLDLSRFQSIKVNVTYHGSAKKLRLILKDANPRYTRSGAPDAPKPNELEFPVAQGTQEVILHFTDFKVASWWIAGNKIPPELGAPQFGNITALEIQPAAGARPGHHTFALNDIRMEGQSLPQAQWYLILLGLWVLAISIFLVHRVMNLRREFEARHQLQEEESQQLEAAWTAAEAASRAKSEFLANMSHELRTPLNAILGYAQLLERAGLAEQHANAARTIHRSGAHLLTLITDILDLAKIEAGKLELGSDPFDLHACVCGVVEMMKVRAEEKALKFDYSLDPGLPRYVTGDEKRIRQLLINLLGNALKFTEQGEVTIHVTVLAAGPDSAHLRFEIRDTGTGIASNKLEQIFEPFEQVGDHAKAGGTGLGLSICRQIVTLMNGKLSVESEEGVGSRFWFDLDLPIVQASGSAEEQKPSAAPEGIGAGRNILVVDDLEANRALLRDILGQLGFAIHEACDGEKAVAAARSVKPDLILMDIKMPVMDGFEATRLIRTFEKLRSTPIITLSASATREVEEQSRSAGADDFLAKPIDHDQLVQMIASQLGITVTGATLSRPRPAAEPIVAPPADQLNILLKLALAGNMRAIRREAKQIASLGAEYVSFAQELERLAAGYQSPAILRLIEQHSADRKAA